MEMERKMKMKRQRQRQIDKISKLPDSLIHQILSYLPTKESARTSVLSKTWLQSYSSFPNLTFDERYFHNSPEIEKNRYPFFNLVQNTLLKYRNLNLSIHKFVIAVFNVDHIPAYRLLNESLEMVFSNGVKQVDISVFAKFDFEPYTLPSTMFESPKMLTYLRVHKCNFPQYVVNCDAIIFPFLKILDLDLAHIDDGMIQKLLSESPLLEKIVFFRVSGFQKFWVSGLGELKMMYVESTSETIEIDIEDAPSLRLVKCLGSLESPCLLKVASAPNLRHLELFSVSVSENSLNELVTKSSLLENLEIYDCYGLERINIVSNSLKRLCFGGCKKLVDVKIDAPSLLELHCNDQNMLSLSLNNTPEGLKPYIHIVNDGLDQLSNAWFHQLRELLKGVKGGKFSFSIVDRNQGIDFDTVQDFRANPLPQDHQKENLMPEINQSSSVFAAFVKTLFSSSRPSTIYNQRSVTPFFADVIKFLVSELITAAGNSNGCCSDQHQSTKCWRHYLKDVKVEVYKDSKKGWQSLPHKTSLSKFTFCGKKMCISLKWYANL